MRFKGSTIVAAASLIAAAASSAGAQNFTNSGCSGNTFLFCASWSGVVSTVAGNNILTLSLTNTSGGAPASNAASKFTQIFIGGIPTSYSQPTVSQNGGAGSWSQDDPPSGIEGFGLVPLLAGVSSNNGQNGGIGPGQTAIIVFNFGTQNLTGAFANVQIGIHDQGVPVGTP